MACDDLNDASVALTALELALKRALDALDCTVLPSLKIDVTAPDAFGWAKSTVEFTAELRVRLNIMIQSVDSKRDDYCGCPF